MICSIPASFLGFVAQQAHFCFVALEFGTSGNQLAL